jgi:hypothetical protein
MSDVKWPEPADDPVEEPQEDWDKDAPPEDE